MEIFDPQGIIKYTGAGFKRRKQNALKAAGYVRVSTSKQVLSPIVQEDLIRKYCEHEGLEIFNIYREVKSGKSIIARPEMVRLIRDAEQLKFMHVIFQDYTRLTRNLKDAHILFDLFEQLGVTPLSVTTPLQAGATGLTPEGELMQNTLLVMGHYERRLLGQRIQRVVRATKTVKREDATNPLLIDRYNRGVMLMGRPPYGWQAVPTGEITPWGKVVKHWVPYGPEQRVIAKIMQMTEMGMTVREITYWLDERVPTRSGKFWIEPVVKNIIMRAISGRALRLPPPADAPRQVGYTPGT